MRTRTSPTSADTVAHCSATGSLSTGAACTLTRAACTSVGVTSYSDAGAAMAPTNAREAGSRTTAAWVSTAVIAGSSGPPRSRPPRVARVHERIDDAVPAGRLGERAVDEDDGGLHDEVPSVAFRCPPEWRCAACGDDRPSAPVLASV